MGKRMDACRRIVADSLSEFSEENKAYFFDFRKKRTIRVANMDKANRRVYADRFSPQQTRRLLDECTQHIHRTLAQWDGVKTSKRCKKKLSSFRDYFTRSKNWFDQTKVAIMVLHFWTPLIDTIHQVECD